MPDNVRAAARLRLAHPDLSLADRAQLAEPPLTRHALAGRIRTLLRLAAHHLAAHDVPRTG